MINQSIMHLTTSQENHWSKLPQLIQWISDVYWFAKAIKKRTTSIFSLFFSSFPGSAHLKWNTGKIPSHILNFIPLFCCLFAPIDIGYASVKILSGFFFRSNASCHLSPVPKFSIQPPAWHKLKWNLWDSNFLLSRYLLRPVEGDLVLLIKSYLVVS